MIFIANTLILNGGTTFLRRICRVYREHGKRVVIIVLQGPVESTIREALGKDADILYMKDLYRARCPIQPLNNLSIFGPLDRYKIETLLREHGTHIHAMGVFGLLAALRLARIDTTIRVSAGVYHQNEFILRGRNRVMAAQMRKLFRKVPDENVFNFNSYVLSEYSRVMERSYSSRNVVPIGILPAAPPRSRVFSRFSIVSVGNLAAFKTYNEHVIRLVARLKGEFPEISYDIYGDGPEMARLTELAASLGISRHVTFHGTIPYEQFPAAVSGAAVFVGSGTALLEAAQLGIPSVVGIESITDPVTYGFLYDCEGLTYNEYIPTKPVVPMEVKLREVLQGDVKTVEAIGFRCWQKSNEFCIEKTYDGFSDAESRLKAVTDHMTFLDSLLFFIVLCFTIATDFLAIDRSFRYRRDSV